MKWHQKEPTVEDAQIKFFTTLEKNFANENESKTSGGKGGKADNKEMESSKESCNAIFGKYIVTKLDELPVRDQKMAKHQITNILYELQMKSANTVNQSQLLPEPTAVPSL